MCSLAAHMVIVIDDIRINSHRFKVGITHITFKEKAI